MPWNNLPWYTYVILVLAGVAAGFVNMLAGNGSLITLPALIFAGLPPQAANATNRVGVVLQGLVGTGTFYQRKRLDVRGTLWLALPTTLGSVLGAQIAVTIDKALFQQVLAVALILMLGLMFVDPKRWLEGKQKKDGRRLTVLRFIIFFAIGVYGGFLQAGIGIFLLVGLVLEAGYDLVRANAVKVGITLAQGLVALLVFSANAQVWWGVGLVLGAGTMVGAWLATQFAVDKGAVWVRRFVIVVVLASSAHLLGVFTALGRLLGLS